MHSSIESGSDDMAESFTHVEKRRVLSVRQIKLDSIVVRIDRHDFRMRHLSTLLAASIHDSFRGNGQFAAVDRLQRGAYRSNLGSTHVIVDSLDEPKAHAVIDSRRVSNFFHQSSLNF